MPMQNRVTPFGDIVASAHRGTLMGNRGCLHNADRTLSRRRWTTKSWVACLLSFGNRPPRQLMRTGFYTELFFLDEATALAAGHRPCAECRREDYRKFVECWSLATDTQRARPKAAQMDQQLHPERVGQDRRKVTFFAGADDLPDGAMVTWAGEAFLKWKGTFWPWSLSGYGEAAERPPTSTVSVLTPRSIVGVLLAGYVPAIHVSVADTARVERSAGRG
jgi:hypothetical protein